MDGDGVIRKEEMLQVLKSEVPEEEMIAEAVQSLFEMFDKDQNGINFEEFKEMSMSNFDEEDEGEDAPEQAFGEGHGQGEEGDSDIQDL